MGVRGCILLSALALAGCAQYAEVSRVRPQLSGAPGSGPLAVVEAALARALGEEHAHPLVALSDCLLALQSTSRELERDPANAAAIRDYDFGIAGIFRIVHDANLAPWGAPLTVSSPAGEFVLSLKPDPRQEWNPALYEYTPADEYDVNGKYVTERTTRPGLGAAIVAVERESREDARLDFAPSRLFYSMTVIARFDGNRCELEFLDPLANESVTFNGRTV